MVPRGTTRSASVLVSSQRRDRRRRTTRSIKCSIFRRGSQGSFDDVLRLPPSMRVTEMRSRCFWLCYSLPLDERIM
jgi:hypothetical protein